MHTHFTDVTVTGGTAKAVEVNLWIATLFISVLLVIMAMLTGLAVPV